MFSIPKFDKSKFKSDLKESDKRYIKFSTFIDDLGIIFKANILRSK